ncbi:MAG: hypothetical protein EPO11_06440 [Gammaproteobacteria bacterium]|nr:MAG: hypothetical protein EPO11_06440 [Gammaproteobacteria bacterium]
MPKHESQSIVANNNSTQFSPLYSSVRDFSTKKKPHFHIIDQIGISGMKAIADALKSGKYPEDLHITFEDNDIGGAEGISAIVEALQNEGCPKRITLQFLHNNMGVAGAIVLAELIKSQKRPQALHIAIGNNKLGSEGVKVIAEAIKNSQGPQYLVVTIGYEKMGMEGAKALAKAIASEQRPQNIQVRFKENDISNETINALIEEMAPPPSLFEGTSKLIGEEKDKLSSLSILVDEELVEEKALDLLHQAQEHTHQLTQLSVLRLSQNNWHAVAALIRKNPNLEKVDLSNCCLGDEGLGGILQALQGCSNLKTLILKNNEITSKGMMILKEFLSQQLLIDLDLSDNKIGAYGLSDFLENASTLTKLHLTKNPIGDNGVEEIVSCLIPTAEQQLLPVLEELYLNDVDMGNKGAKKIAELLSSHCHLSSVALENNEGISQEGVNDLVEGLTKSSVFQKVKLPTQAFNISSLQNILKSPSTSEEPAVIQPLRKDAAAFFSQQAEEAIGRGDYAAAVKCYSDAMECNPSNEMAQRERDRANLLFNEKFQQRNKLLMFGDKRKEKKTSISVNELEAHYELLKKEWKKFNELSTTLYSDVLPQEGRYLREQVALLQSAIQSNLTFEKQPRLYPLYRAIKAGDTKKIQALVDMGFDINMEDPNGNIALHFAAREGNKEMIKYLISSGAKAHHRNKDGKDPWYFANQEDIKSLLNAARNYTKRYGDNKKAPLRVIAESISTQSLGYIMEQEMLIGKLQGMIAVMGQMEESFKVAEKSGLLDQQQLKTSLEKELKNLLDECGLKKLPDRKNIMILRSHEKQEELLNDKELKQLLDTCGLKTLPSGAQLDAFLYHHNLKTRVNSSDLTISVVERYDFRKLYEFYKDAYAFIISMGPLPSCYKEDIDSLKELENFLTWMKSVPTYPVKKLNDKCGLLRYDIQLLKEKEAKLQEEENLQALQLMQQVQQEILETQQILKQVTEEMERFKAIEEYCKVLSAVMADMIIFKDEKFKDEELKDENLKSPTLREKIHSLYQLVMHEKEIKELETEWNKLDDDSFMQEAQGLWERTSLLQKNIYQYKVTFKQRNQLYPLYDAIKYNDKLSDQQKLNRITRLIRRGYDPNMIDPEGNTALDFAMQLENLEEDKKDMIIKHLISLGAISSHVNNNSVVQSQPNSLIICSSSLFPLPPQVSRVKINTLEQQPAEPRP